MNTFALLRFVVLTTSLAVADDIPVKDTIVFDDGTQHMPSKNFHLVVISENPMGTSAADVASSPNVTLTSETSVELIPASGVFKQGSTSSNTGNIVTSGDKPIAEPVPKSKKTRSTEPTKSVAAEVSHVDKSVKSESVHKIVSVTNEGTNSTKVNSTKTQDLDLDVDDFPETDRESRKAEVKTEAATHDVALDTIEEKLSEPGVSFEAIREVLGTLVGPDKAEAIMPKAGDATVTRTRRSVSPDKLPKHKLVLSDVKQLQLGKSKGGRILKKKFRTKRGNFYGTNVASAPAPLPELSVPSNSNSPSSSTTYVAPDQPSYRYALRTTPVRSSGSRYSTDLSDLPVNRDWAERFRQADAGSVVRQVKVIYEFTVPMDVSAMKGVKTYDTSGVRRSEGDALEGADDGYSSSSSTSQVTPAPPALAQLPEIPVPILGPSIRIAVGDNDISDGDRRFKRSPASTRDLEKRRVPTILSQVSRFTRGGPNGLF